MKLKRGLTVLFALVLTVLMAVPVIFGSGVYAEQGDNSIDLYLIAGQSNASGTTNVADKNAAYEVAPELENGFSNVLYAGKYSLDTAYVDWTPAKLGFGHTIFNTDGSVRADRLGPEAGMAVALSEYYNGESGRVAGILKYAHGGTKLSGKEKDNTWASPSYYAAYGSTLGFGEYATNDNTATVGRQYVELLNVFRTGVQSLLDDGYTDINIKGIYWMQGEGDRQDNDPANMATYYGNALEYFIGDLRSDLSVIMEELCGDGVDASVMPFFIGGISETFGLVSTTEIEKNQRFIEIQKSVAAKVENCYFIDNTRYKVSRYDADEGKTVPLGSDTYHWKQSDMLSIGQSVGYGMYNLGAVPAEFASVTEYPFVVFNEGEFMGAFDGFGSALSLAKNALGGTPESIITVFMRADATVNSAENIGELNGTVVLDLGGNTLTGSIVFDGASVGAVCKVQNGTVVADSVLSANGSGNRTEFIFDNVAFYNDGGEALFSGDSAVAITLNDCTVNIRGAAAGYTVFDTAADVKLIGGEIVGDNSFGNVTLYSEAAKDGFVFGAKPLDDYTTVTVPAGCTVSDMGGVNGKGDKVIFGNPVNEGASTVYSLTEDADGIVTKYGTIPAEYGDPLAYPFAIFKNGRFVNATAYWLKGTAQSTDSVLQSLLLYLRGDYDAQYQVLLRRDYDVTSAGNTVSNFNLTQLGGEIIFDLDGHTLKSPTTGSYLFFMNAYYFKDDLNGKNHIYPTTITVRNGYISASNPLISQNSIVSDNAAWDTDKISRLTFEGVSFTLPYGGILRTSNKAHATHSHKLYLTFNDCEFKLSRNDIVIFRNTSGDAVNNRVFVTVNGGIINAGAYGNTTLTDFSSAKDSITFGKGANGYTEYVATREDTVFSGAFNTTENGASYFGLYSQNSNTYIYHPGEMTAYGVIPHDFTAQDYPFAIFKDGKLVNATAYWLKGTAQSTDSVLQSLLLYLRGDYDAQYQVLLRRDYDVTSAGNTVSNFNLTQLGGEIIFDLDGHTLKSPTTGSYLFFMNAYYFKDDLNGKNHIYPTTITVRNGYISASNPLISQNSIVSDNAAWDTDKISRLTFEGVSFTLPYGGILRTSNKAHATHSHKLYLTFNDCEFKLSRNDIVIFQNTSGDAVNNRVFVTVNGGKITSASYGNTTVAKFTSSKDSVVFGKYNGEYTVINGTKLPNDTEFFNVDGTRLSIVGNAGNYVFSEACSHAYDNDYDPDCNICGEIRPVEIPYEGEVSRKIFWAFEDGVLTVTGRGKIKNFSAGVTPWSHLADKITKVVIGEGLTYIGSSAFYCCANIESVELPESLTAMGNYVFYGCSALKSIEIPEAVTEIGKYSFRRSGLETIDFAIGYGWSAGDREFSIADIISGGHRFISKSYYKQTWTRNVDAEVETLDPNYVAGGIMHTDVIWELTNIGNGNLKLTIRGNGAMADYGTAGAPWYAYWEKITEIEIQNGVTTVGRCAFYGLKFVRKVTVADSVTAIGDYGFYMCRLLKSIELPEDVTIGTDAFVKTGVIVNSAV